MPKNKLDIKWKKKYESIIPSREDVVMRVKLVPSNKKSMLAFFITLMVFAFMIAFALFYKENTEGAIFVCLFILGIGVTSFFSMKNSRATYLIGKEGVIMDYHSSIISPRKVKYESIYAIKRQSQIIHDAIVFYTKKEGETVEKEEGNLPQFRNMAKPKEVMETVIPLWFPKSPYSKLNELISNWSSKNNVNFHPMTYDDFLNKRKGPRWNFNIKNIPVQVRMDKLDSEIRIIYECEINNPEHFFLRIIPQNIITSFKKLSGMKDYKVGNTNWDKNYILDTNYPDYIPSVFNSDLQKDMLQIIAVTGKPVSIFLGDVKKELGNEKIKSLDFTSDLLDDISWEEGKVRDEENNSKLKMVVKYPTMFYRSNQKSLDDIHATFNTLFHNLLGK